MDNENDEEEFQEPPEGSIFSEVMKNMSQFLGPEITSLSFMNILTGEVRRYKVPQKETPITEADLEWMERQMKS